MTQGDLEKSLGWNPVPLFDRNRAADMPVMQVQFYILDNTDIFTVFLENLGKKNDFCCHSHEVYIFLFIGFIVVYSVMQNTSNNKIQADVN